MASAFAITPATSSVKLDSQGRGELTFTVTNTSGKPIRARAKVVTEDPKHQPWFRLEGEAERNFPADKSTDQFVVKVNAPPNTPPGKALMHLDMFSVENPQDVFSKGPTVSWELVKAAEEKKKFPWWIIAAAAVAVVVIGVAVYFLMGGKKVPDVVNMSFADAQKKIEEAGMKLGQKTDRKAGKAPGIVIAQTPAAGEKIPDHKTINLDVEPEPPRDVEVPSVVGRSITDAQDILTKAGLTAGKFSYDMSAPGNPNTVLSQNPRQGIRVTLGQEVEMVVKGDSVQVPSLIGADFQNAALQLQNRDLLLQMKEQDMDPKIRKPGTVLNQDPAPNAMVARKSQVVLTVAKEPFHFLVISPVFAGKLNATTIGAMSRSVKPQTTVPK